jgi:hypothetical protein
LSCDSVGLEWIVGSVVVDSINTELERRPFSHEVQKSLEAFAIWIIFVPLRTHMYTSLTIVLERYVLWVFTPNMHHPPDAILPDVFGYDRLPHATAILLRGMLAQNVIFRNVFFLTTNTTHLNY